MFNQYLQYVWYICTDNLLPIAPYTSLGTLDTDKTVQIPSEPLENGKLMAYNNVREPERVNATLFFDGDYAVQTLGTAMLDTLIESGETVTIFSPTRIWRNMALDHYDFSRSNDSGATLLAVTCSFTEIQSVVVENLTYSSSSTKKATSVSKVSSGQVNTSQATQNTMLHAITHKGK